MVAMIRLMTAPDEINAMGIAYYRRPTLMQRVFGEAPQAAAFLPAFRRTH